MKIVLRADVDNLGNKGDLVEVAPGYARNYLVPKGLAIAASPGVTRQAEAMRRSRQVRDRREKEGAEATARQLRMAWGITPVLDEHRASSDEVVWFAVEAAVRRGLVKRGDVVAVVVGSPVDPEPVTDTLRLVRVR